MNEMHVESGAHGKIAGKKEHRYDIALFVNFVDILYEYFNFTGFQGVKSAC